MDADITRYSKLFKSGVLFMGVWLLVIEICLHSDFIMHRFRSVFAVGRALDKVLYIEEYIPSILIAGNSRVDNGIKPKFFVHKGEGREAFNLGIPGANARDLFHIFKRLDAKGVLGKDGVKAVLLGVDESMVQADQGLGYTVFFADFPSLLARGEYHAVIQSMLRLYGHHENFKTMREPEKLIRFIKSIFLEIPPIGGPADLHLGYRKADELAQQNDQQIERQTRKALLKPHQEIVEYLFALFNLLESRGVKVGIFFPPVLDRKLLYLDDRHSYAQPYLELAKRFQSRKIPLVFVSDDLVLTDSDFANPGHLNDKGAELFSKSIASKYHEMKLIKL